MTPVRVGILFMAASMAATLLVVAQEQDPQATLHASVDGVFAAYDRQDSPGCALGVIRDGELIYEGGYGMANLEYGIPITADSVFRTGSVSKQFTAMAVALAAEQGKLSLDDDIRKTLPELPDFGSLITIRHLIHHTSGIRDYLELMELAGKRDEDYYDDEDVLDMLARQEALNFEPGSEMLYSNSGYFLLSQIILRATGETLRQFATRNIFGPLKMENTHYHSDPTEIVRNRASGYTPVGYDSHGNQVVLATFPLLGDGELAFRISMTTLPMIGDGGVFTSVRDLVNWDRNFYDNVLGDGDRSLIELVETPGALNDGRRLDYAFGLRVSRYRGLKIAGHAGSFVGFRAATVRFPEKRFSVVCLCNVSTAEPNRLALRVADVYLGDEMAPAAERDSEERREVPIVMAPEPDVAELSKYVGRYHSRELDVTYEFVADVGGLWMAQPNALQGSLFQEDEDRFLLGQLEVEFLRDERGGVTGFSLSSGRVRNIRFERSSN